ncbi:MAG TPA: hypothetical protein PLB12_01610 [Candidatus Goldiibacteriota bacterium]|nr:hypothetical protein [Candidatus Goldiibacteriota bacterium]HPN63853.1 hypothetical protein [Candidatus Goldiibacteriota bacterium]HRQ43028.1 hypothetical protein [Candidatus Goldiibacteriota bacterium]
MKKIAVFFTALLVMAACTAKPEKIEKVYYPSGKLLAEMPMVKGLKHGKIIWYYESGDIKTTQEVKRGAADGRIIFYYEGNIKEHEGVIKNGKRIGEFKYYDRQGKLIKSEFYSNGSVVKEKTYTP